MFKTTKRILDSQERLEKKIDELTRLMVQNEVWKGAYERGLEERRELYKALLARDLPELATYGGAPSVPREPDPYDPMKDTQNAGGIISDET